MPDGRPGPEARYEKREAISLAFIAALQLLPTVQRGVLVLRDVLLFGTGRAYRLAGTRIRATTRFDKSSLTRFDLPAHCGLTGDAQRT